MGFFQSSTWQKPAPVALIPKCDLCKLYEKCKSPKMPVSGRGEKKVLIVAEAPGETEDEKGIQLVGNSGFELIQMLRTIGIDMRKDCWLTNSVICRPTDEKGANRKPSDKEIEYCKPNLLNTIERLKPNVIIPLGYPATKSIVSVAWKPGEVDDIGSWVKWTIPSQKFNSWICPTWHPSFLLHSKDQVAKMLMFKHLRKAFSLCKEKPWPGEVPDWKKDITIITNPSVACEKINEFLSNETRELAFDFENSPLKPDRSDSYVLCNSISDGETTIAYPLVGETIQATKRFLLSPNPKLGANIKHEERWSRKIFGTGVRNWMWDIVLGAHWLDCRHGITSLKFQSFVLLGQPDYDSHIKPWLQADDSNTHNRIKEIDINQTLLYNGMDSLLAHKVAQIQRKGTYE